MKRKSEYPAALFSKARYTARNFWSATLVVLKGIMYAPISYKNALKAPISLADPHSAAIKGNAACNSESRENDERLPYFVSDSVATLPNAKWKIFSINLEYKSQVLRAGNGNDCGEQASFEWVQKLCIFLAHCNLL